MIQVIVAVAAVGLGCSKKEPRVQSPPPAQDAKTSTPDATPDTPPPVDAPPPPPIDAPTGDEPEPGATPMSCTHQKDKACVEWLPPADHERAALLVRACDSEHGESARSGCAKRFVIAKCVTPKNMFWRYYKGASLEQSKTKCIDVYKGEWSESTRSP
jgi:hypothetical protein